jgi:sulfopyruvate decarboxylase alpha subunit
MNAQGNSETSPTWPAEIHEIFRSAGIRQVGYVPDSGHAELIRLCHADPEIICVPLTSEEEGIGLMAGAWLGGQRSALLMQSSGVGNCVNLFSLAINCRFPALLLVTMRGEWGEFNPAQLPMGRAVRPVIEQMGGTVHRADEPAAVKPTVEAALKLAFQTSTLVAVTLGQKLIGAKSFSVK